MGQVTISVNNKSFTLACKDGEEERLGALADYVNGKVEELVENLGQVGDSRLMLMACLLVTDELKDAEDRVEKAKAGDTRDLIAEAEAKAAQAAADLIARATTQVDTLAERLENA